MSEPRAHLLSVEPLFTLEANESMTWMTLGVGCAGCGLAGGGHHAGGRVGASAHRQGPRGFEECATRAHARLSPGCFPDGVFYAQLAAHRGEVRTSDENEKGVFVFMLLAGLGSASSDVSVHCFYLHFVFPRVVVVDTFMFRFF